MTPAIQLLQREKVRFTQHPYDHEAGADSYGLEAATKLGVEPQRVFKTLVCSGDDGALLLVLIPSSGRLDLKALARTLGVHKANLADPRAAERTTGYVVGGISPLGGRKRLPALIDASLADHTTIFVSAGRRGLMLELAPADLVRLTGATLVSLCD